MIEILFIASIILTIICISNLYKQLDLNDFAESYFWLILTDISALSIMLFGALVLKKWGLL